MLPSCCGPPATSGAERTVAVGEVISIGGRQHSAPTVATNSAGRCWWPALETPLAMSAVATHPITAVTVTDLTASSAQGAILGVVTIAMNAHPRTKRPAPMSAAAYNVGVPKCAVGARAVPPVSVPMATKSGSTVEMARNAARFRSTAA